uniref:Uncharacterized protein n=1 Tax=Vitrella brassicaformis TaxID=1169539 RepID=A0A7S1PCG2_9ALVE
MCRIGRLLTHYVDQLAERLACREAVEAVELCQLAVCVPALSVAAKMREEGMDAQGGELVLAAAELGGGGGALVQLPDLLEGFLTLIFLQYALQLLRLSPTAALMNAYLSLTTPCLP